MGELQGQTAVITGAAQGLGYGIAKAYVAEGMKVALMDVRATSLKTWLMNVGHWAATYCRSLLI